MALDINIYKEFVKKNKDQHVNKQWLINTYLERTQLNKLIAAGDQQIEINLLNEKYSNYPVHPLDWTYDELSELWHFFTEQERTSKVFELLFAKKHPDFELQLKNAKNINEEQDLLKTKESFIQKKLSMKTRFASNKNQTYDVIVNKFDRIKRFFNGYKRGKLQPAVRLNPRLKKNFKRHFALHKYKDDIVFNNKYKKPYWFKEYSREGVREYFLTSNYFNIARLYIRKSFSNIFLTLTDINDKVIYTITTGMVSTFKNLKVKRSIDVLEKMISNLKDKLEFIKITNLQVVLKSRCKWHYKILKTELSKFGINIISILDQRITAHNGVRKKNKARK